MTGLERTSELKQPVKLRCAVRLSPVTCHLSPVSVVAVLLLISAAAVGAWQVAAPPRPSSPPQATIGPESHIQPPSASYHFPRGETYYYLAEWRLWNAGTATLRMGPPPQPAREQRAPGTPGPAGPEQQVFGAADSTGFVALLYPVHDRFQATFDPRTFCSINVSKHTEEGFHKRDTLIRFDYSRHKSILDETNLKNKEVKHTERDIPNCVTDVVSGIFYLGSLPLVPDATYTFPLNDGGQTVDVKAHVEAREDIKTEAGTFRAIRVSPQATAGVVKERGRIWIWYSDDERRIPVQIRARMFWGTLTFTLQRIEKQ